MAASRAVVRWAWRLFRREWRQQSRVLALLTVVVAVTAFTSTAAYNVAPDAATFGSASHYLTFDLAGPDALAADTAAAEEHFGAVDVITRRSIAIPGSVESVELRGQDPQGPYGGPTLAVREGRYPAGADEVAVTDGIADAFALEVGGLFALGGGQWTVVGLVENPGDLNEDFALVAPGDRAAESVTFLVRTDLNDVNAFRIPSQPDGIEVGERSEDVSILSAVAVLVVSVVALMLVGLVATASFVVVAQRRQRQLGMLAAIGATEQHLRLVTVANGAAVGLFAAVCGAALGAGAWIAAVPLVEPALGYRIDALNVPWWLVGMGALLAVVTSTAAAWWPARAVARIPITVALSGRPPRPTPVHRSTGLAVLLLAGGVAGLIAGDPAGLADGTAEPFGNPMDVLLLGGGMLATVLGVLLISPLAIRALALVAGRMPVAARLAVRDLVRYQSRSGVALAAISLALGISVAVIVGASAAEHGEAEGNVSERQLLVWTRDDSQPEGVSPYYTEDPNDAGFSPFLPALTPADLREMDAAIQRLAAQLDDGAAIAELDLALDPAHPSTHYGSLGTTLAKRAGDGYNDIALVFVATPELLRHHGVDLGAVRPGTEVLTVEEGELVFPGIYDPSTQNYRTERVSNIEVIPTGYSSLPGSFITPEALEARGWESRRVGWLIETGSPVTTEQLAAVREAASDAGLLVEARRGQPSIAPLRTGATAAGMLVALSILAMTVGLIRGEGAADLRTLTATGATSSMRRTLTAATAGVLALLGATLGIAGVYAALAAGLSSDLGALSPVPFVHLAVIGAGVPLAAAAAGWLVAGREPPALARQALE
ncbi:MAG: FtsX-like permease family protein [Dehalococcoidia bacterium]|nr:FtsX-like permease family protein [Dehalococcoidia bacterium]